MVDIVLGIFHRLKEKTEKPAEPVDLSPLYEEEMSWESIVGSRRYISSLPYAVYAALYDVRLDFAGIKTPRSDLTDNIKAELNDYKTGKNEFKHYGCDKPDCSIDIALLLKKYDVEYYKKRNYSVKVVGANGGKVGVESACVKHLAEKIKSCSVCWEPLDEKGRVVGHLLDMQQGGCKLVFVEKDGETKAFNRFYFLKDDKDRIELLWDTVEGGDYSRDTIKDWKKDEVLGVLVLSIYSAIAMSSMAGCERLYVSEPEVTEFFDNMFVPMGKHPFKRDRGKKIGINEKSEDKLRPYFYHLKRDRTRFEYLPLDCGLSMDEAFIRKKFLTDTIKRIESDTKGRKTQRKLDACYDALSMYNNFENLLR